MGSIKQRVPRTRAVLVRTIRWWGATLHRIRVRRTRAEGAARATRAARRSRSVESTGAASQRHRHNAAVRWRTRTRDPRCVGLRVPPCEAVGPMNSTNRVGISWTISLLTLGVLLCSCSSASSKSQTSHVGRDAHRTRVEDVATAGNRVQYSLGDVQQGRDPRITGGVADPFGSAYAQLCSALKRTTSEAQFRHSRASAISSVLTADSEQGSGRLTTTKFAVSLRGEVRLSR